MDADLPSSFTTFQQIAGARRSVRAFLSEALPQEVLERCVDIAICAPSSQNLEVWRFIDVRTAAIRAELNRLCLHQPQAEQAPTLIVVAARPDLWRVGCARMLERLAHDAEPPPTDPTYRAWLPRLTRKYRLLIPLLFKDGPMHMLAPLKSFTVWLYALSKPMMRGPFGRAEKELWAVKTAALACENFMLALAAAGFDSCPMEGFDEPRVKRLLSLPRAARIVMVIAAGRRGPGALLPQFRFEREHYFSSI
jgi:nitroreductase